MRTDTYQWASVLLLGGALACAVSFQAIGSQVEPDVIPWEPFALIPIGYGLAAGSIASLTLSLIWRPRNP